MKLGQVLLVVAALVGAGVGSDQRDPPAEEVAHEDHARTDRGSSVDRVLDDAVRTVSYRKAGLVDHVAQAVPAAADTVTLGEGDVAADEVDAFGRGFVEVDRVVVDYVQAVEEILRLNDSVRIDAGDHEFGVRLPVFGESKRNFAAISARVVTQLARILAPVEVDLRLLHDDTRVSRGVATVLAPFVGEVPVAHRAEVGAMIVAVARSVLRALENAVRARGLGQFAAIAGVVESLVIAGAIVVAPAGIAPRDEDVLLVEAVARDGGTVGVGGALGVGVRGQILARATVRSAADRGIAVIAIPGFVHAVEITIGGLAPEVILVRGAGEAAVIVELLLHFLVAEQRIETPHALLPSAAAEVPFDRVPLDAGLAGVDHDSTHGLRQGKVGDALRTIGRVGAVAVPGAAVDDRRDDTALERLAVRVLGADLIQISQFVGNLDDAAPVGVVAEARLGLRRRGVLVAGVAGDVVVRVALIRVVRVVAVVDPIGHAIVVVVVVVFGSVIPVVGAAIAGVGRLVGVEIPLLGAVAGEEGEGDEDQIEVAHGCVPFLRVGYRCFVFVFRLKTTFWLKLVKKWSPTGFLNQIVMNDWFNDFASQKN